MITITNDPHAYQQLKRGAPIWVDVPPASVAVNEWHPVGEPWAIRKLYGGYAVEYLLTGESYFVSRDNLEALVLPAETWHPAETLPDWAVRWWVLVRAGMQMTDGRTMVLIQATQGTPS
jgi:hypothetical protein